MIQIAFDIGGTFTDFALRDLASGQVRIWKVPTTQAPERAVINSLSELIERGQLKADEVSSVSRRSEKSLRVRRATMGQRARR
jgi:N-methylhydantoinase A